MNIGTIKRKSYKDKPYFELSINMAFMPKATFTVRANEDKQNDNAPDFHIYYKLERKTRVGAIWNKVTDAGMEYKQGHIETPFAQNGKLEIAIFASKKLDNEDVAPTWTHDVVWSAPRPASQDNNQTQNTQAPTQNSVTVIDIDEDEIPF